MIRRQPLGHNPKRLDKLTSASEYAASGLKKINNIISGMAFGAVIGAVSAVTQALINHYKTAERTREEIDRVSSALMDQRKAWKILPEPIDKVTESTIALHNAELKRQQFLERNTGKEIRRQIEELEKANLQIKEAERRLQEIGVNVAPAGVVSTFLSDITKLPPEIDKLTGKWHNNNVEIQRLNKAYEDWLELMKQTDASAGKVNANFAKPSVTSSFGDNITKMIQEGNTLQNRLQGGKDGLSLNVPLALDWTMMSGAVGMDNDLIEQKQKELEAHYVWQADFDRRMAEQKTSAQTELARIEASAYDLEIFGLIDKNTRKLQLMVDAGASEIELLEAHSAAVKAIDEKTKQNRLAVYASLANQMSVISGQMYTATWEKQKAFFYLQRALAVTSIFINTEVAAKRAQAEGGIYIGLPLSTWIRVTGYASMAAVAASTIGSKGGGAPGGSNGAAGGGGVGALPIAPPETVQQETRPSLTIVIEKAELLGDDAIANFAHKISEAVEKYDVKLVASRTVS
ncbi:MAG: hypothetical protein HS130_00880 [Deltaproteobacteria bacterium]|nr:hypothetical protein [Deltaproteobacteria bacterium]